MASTRSVEERLADAEQQAARAQERVRRLRAQASGEERKARSHALVTVGGIVTSHCEWRDLDWDAMASWAASQAGAIARCASHGGSTVEEARARLRDWERRGREAAGR